MKQYIPLDKRSKKEQKKYYSKNRRTWGDLNPVTRTVPNGKAYNRNKDKQERRRVGIRAKDGFDTGLSCFIGNFFGFLMADCKMSPVRTMNA